MPPPLRSVTNLGTSNDQSVDDKAPEVSVRMRIPCAAVLWIALAVTSFAAESEVPTGGRVTSEYWATRAGVSMRVLIMAPPEQRGGVILLPGGHGNINLDVQAHIGWGQDDFVIRTRVSYPRAGFTTVIPDIAIDRKP